MNSTQNNTNINADPNLNSSSDIHLVSLKNDHHISNQLTSWANTVNSSEEFYGLCLSLATKLETEGLQGLNKALGSLNSISGKIENMDFLNLVQFLKETNWDDFEKNSQQTKENSFKADLRQLDKSINHFFSHFDVILNSSVFSPKIYALGQTAITNLLLDLFEIKLV